MTGSIRGKLMNHKGTQQIETDRLLLRRFTERDIQASFRNWTSDEKMTEFLRWPAHSSVEVTRKVMSEWFAAYEKVDFYQWAIEVKDRPDGVIGAISAGEANERVGSVQIGYCLGTRWWGQGIMTEAFAGIIPFLFEEVRVNRIAAQHDPANPASGNVMRKCGLVYEGTLRQADFSNKGIVDAAVYGLLARDFFPKEMISE